MREVDSGLRNSGFSASDELRVTHTISRRSFEMKDAETLRSMVVKAAQYYSAEWADDPLIQMSFECRKRESVKELLIRDMTLIVSEFSEAPKALKHGLHETSVMEHGFRIPPEAFVSFSLFKKPEPVPWVFKATEFRSDLQVYNEFKPLVLTDNFTCSFRVRLRGLEPGIYKITIRLELEPDFQTTTSLAIPGMPANILFATMRAQPPKEGEHVMTISPSGRFVTSFYEPSSPLFLRPPIVPFQGTPPPQIQPGTPGSGPPISNAGLAPYVGPPKERLGESAAQGTTPSNVSPPDLPRKKGD